MPVGEQENIIDLPPLAVSSPKAARLPVLPESRESPPADTIEAPYRNTRSRSRSVESSVLHTQLPARKTKAKQKKEVSMVPVVKDEVAEASGEGVRGHKRKKKETVHLDPLEETKYEDDASPDIHMKAPIGISLGESLRDENDVMDFLAMDSIEEGTTFVTDNGEQHLELDAQLAQHGGAFDPDDDKQTDYHLRQPPVPSLSQHPTSILLPLIDPEQALQRFNASLSQSTRRPTVQSSMSRTRTRTLAVASRVTRAPVRIISPTRFGSESSAESYPLIGTRARKVKENIQRDEKGSPYRPPTGTRAAQYSQSK